MAAARIAGAAPAVGAGADQHATLRKKLRHSWSRPDIESWVDVVSTLSVSNWRTFSRHVTDGVSVALREVLRKARPSQLEDLRYDKQDAWMKRDYRRLHEVLEYLFSARADELNFITRKQVAVGHLMT